MRISTIAGALIVTVLAALPASAEIRPEHPYRVHTGQRVRLWSTPEHGGYVHTSAVVTATDATGLTVVIKDRTALVPFAGLTRLDLRRGWRYMRRAAVIALVVGAAAGALAENGDSEDVARSAAIYGAVGAGVGALTAGAIWPARWIPVDLDSIRLKPDAAAMPFAPGRSAARISFTISF